jgi:hypothetical protein
MMMNKYSRTLCNTKTLIYPKPYLSSTSKKAILYTTTKHPKLSPHQHGLTRPAEPNKTQTEPQFGSQTLDLGIPQPFLSQLLDMIGSNRPEIPSSKTG